MAAVAGLVALPGHGLAAHRPLEIAVGIAAQGEVGDLSGFHIYQADIIVIHALLALIAGEDVTAVRAPLETEVAVGIGIIDAFGDEDLLLAAVGAADHQPGAVAQICQPLAIGRHARLEADLSFGGDALFLGAGGEGEGLIILVGEFTFVDSPFAVTLGVVEDAAAILSEGHPALLLGGIGDAAGISQLQRGHEDISPGDHGNFLAIGGCCESAD